MRRLVARRRFVQQSSGIVIPSSVYWGVRADGDYYATCYGSPNTADLPFIGSTDAGAALDLVTAHAGKAPTACQFGGNAGAWPPARFYPSDAQRAFDRGMFCQYDWGTSATGLDDLLANNATAISYLTTLAQQLQSFGYPILFRPLWEPNGGWFAWGRSSYTAAEYVTMWRNLWHIFADVLSSDGTSTGNVTFFWCPNITTTGTDADLTDRWPGASYVDATGFDGYIGTAHFGTAYKTPEELYGPTRDLILALPGAAGLPMCIGEMGVGADLEAPGKVGFFTAMFGVGGWLDQNSIVKYVNYFNDNSAEQAANQSLCFEQDTIQSSFAPGNTVTAPEQAFADAISRDYFETNIVNPTTFPIGGKVPFPA